VVSFVGGGMGSGILKKEGGGGVEDLDSVPTF
jgi:hypothetical protein